jgi:hypothetical protein
MRGAEGADFFTDEFSVQPGYCCLGFALHIGQIVIAE